MFEDESCYNEKIWRFFTSTKMLKVACVFDNKNCQRFNESCTSLRGSLNLCVCVCSSQVLSMKCMNLDKWQGFPMFSRVHCVKIKNLAILSSGNA